MSAVSSEADPLLTPRQDHRQLSRCCKLSYKPRKFSSKGAVLVLVWQLMAVSAIPDKFVAHDANKLDIILSALIIIFTLLTCLSVGWLADVRFGRLKVVKAGLLLMWLGWLILNLDSFLSNTFHIKYPTVFKILHSIGILCTSVGGVTFEINILQFGLEQMPDSSSVGITAFISWFTITTFAGLWLKNSCYRLLKFCTFDTLNFLLPPCITFTFMSIAICSMFLFSHWLIDHRQKHNPLKTVYQVLKFAKQHKYPVQRSAFTYWEEEIPSRIDLGKTKYGGPFTTEEVEDVKTFFRILAVLIIVSGLAVNMFGLFEVIPHVHVKKCNTQFIDTLTYGILVVICLLYEVLLYPVMNCRFSMLRRIGCCVFLSFIVSLTLLVFCIESVYGPIDFINYAMTHHWVRQCFISLCFLVAYVLFTSLLEFAYSQSPERMKGFLIGNILCAGIIMAFILSLLNQALNSPCRNNKYCSIYISSVVTVFSFVVFVFYCCVARWYKWRERDEPCNERAIIEEIYGRHVEHNSIEETNTS